MDGPKLKSGNHKRVQLVVAKRKGISALGKKYKAGDTILHLSSTRSTGEAFILLPNEVKKVMGKKPAMKWESAHPKRPKIKKIWVKLTYPNCMQCGCNLNPAKKCVGHLRREREGTWHPPGTTEVVKAHSN